MFLGKKYNSNFLKFDYLWNRLAGNDKLFKLKELKPVFGGDYVVKVIRQSYENGLVDLLYITACIAEFSEGFSVAEFIRDFKTVIAVKAKF